MDLYTLGEIPGTCLCQRLSRPQGHSAAGRIKSMKNLKGPIQNQTRDLLACSAVPQPTALSTIARTKCNFDALLGKSVFNCVVFLLRFDRNTSIVIKY